MLAANPIRSIQNDSDLDLALARIDDLIHAPPGSPEEQELVRLFHLVESYEAVHYPIPEPSQAAMLDFMLDQKMLSRRHLLPLAGTAARLDDMLAGRTPIPPAMARAIAEQTGFPIATLPAVTPPDDAAGVPAPLADAAAPPPAI